MRIALAQGAAGGADPLDGLLPPPGDPSALESQARRFTDMNRAVDDSKGRQDRAVASITGSTWRGIGAESARGGAVMVVDAYRRAGDDLGRATKLLTECAAEWEQARGRYAQARALADEALAEEAARSAVDERSPPAPAWESPLRQQAQSIASGANDIFETASRKAAAALDQLADRVADTPAFISGHHHHWYDDPVRWASDGEHAVAHGVARSVDAFAYALAHPDQAIRLASDLLQISGGVLLTGASATGIGAGILLDGTGIGIPAGVAVDTACVAGVAAGAGLSMHGIKDAIGDVSNLYSKSAGDDGSPSTGPRVPARITGYTDHGLGQVLGRDSGLGVSDAAIEDAVENPTRVVEQDNDTFQFVGKDATVVLNSDGKLVTSWANGSSGWRNAP